MPQSATPKVVIYTWTVCPYCVRAKDLFRRKGIEFQEINLDGHDEELEKLRERTKWRTVPQIFVNDQFLGGFTDVAKLDATGELDQILSGS